MVLCIQEDQNVGLSAYFKTIITCLKQGNEFHWNKNTIFFCSISLSTLPPQILLSTGIVFSDILTFLWEIIFLQPFAYKFDRLPLEISGLAHQVRRHCITPSFFCTISYFDLPRPLLPGQDDLTKKILFPRQKGVFFKGLLQERWKYNWQAAGLNRKPYHACGRK